MENRQHALRSIVLKISANGTAEVLAEQRLYQGSYGFIKLQVYVPKTQNTEAPILSAFCTTVDELGKEKISTHNYRLLFVDEYEIDGLGYLLFERYLPKEFTETVTQPNGLKITLNYNDSAPTRDEAGTVLLDSNGIPERHATDLLVSSRYITTVYPGGWNDESMELDISDAEAAQIAENMRDIEDLQETVEGVKSHIDDITEKAEQVVENTVKSTETKYQYGDSATIPPSGAWAPEPPEPNGKEFFWSKTVFTFVNGSSREIYTVARKGDKGVNGVAAGFGKPTASAISVEAGEEPTVKVTASGEDTKKVFDFAFTIPKGEKGDDFYSFSIEGGNLILTKDKSASENVRYYIDGNGDLILNL